MLKVKLQVAQMYLDTRHHDGDVMEGGQNEGPHSARITHKFNNC